MRRLLVPLDGTPFAEAALPLARTIARHTGAELLLVHGVDLVPPIAPPGDGFGPPLVDATTTHAVRRARQDYLDDVVARTTRALQPAVADRRGGAPPDAVSPAGAPPPAEVPVRGALVEGAAARTLRDAALEAEPDLVVMATHASGGLARLLGGSVTETMVRAHGLPVLAVPPGATDADPHLAVAPDAATAEGPLPRHLLVALDGSPEAEAILPPALALAGALGARVTLATVRDAGRADRVTLLPTALLTDDATAVERPADEAAYLAAVAARLAPTTPVRTQVLDGHPVVDTLLAAADALGVDWLALATHARGPLGCLLEGDVAHALLARAARPVLLLHP